MKVQQLENKSKVDVTKLDGLLVLVNEKVHKPGKINFVAMFSDEVTELPTKEVHLIEFLMPNNAFLHRIECSPKQAESAVNRMLDVYNRHMKLILEVV